MTTTKHGAAASFLADRRTALTGFGGTPASDGGNAVTPAVALTCTPTVKPAHTLVRFLCTCHGARPKQV